LCDIYKSLFLRETGSGRCLFTFFIKSWTLICYEFLFQLLWRIPFIGMLLKVKNESRRNMNSEAKGHNFL